MKDLEGLQENRLVGGEKRRGLLRGCIGKQGLHHLPIYTFSAPRQGMVFADKVNVIILPAKWDSKQKDKGGRGKENKFWFE